MAFEVRVDGAVVKTYTDQVIGVHVRTAHGEAAALGISDVGAVDITVDVVNINDPVRLDVLEARRQDERSQYMDSHEGEPSGPTPRESDETLNVKQNILEARDPMLEPDPEEPPVGDTEFSVS